MSKKKNTKGAAKKVNQVTPAPSVAAPAASVTPTTENQPASAPTEPVVDPKPTTEKPAVNVVQIGDMEKIAAGYRSGTGNGLDPNHQVDVLNGLKGMFHDDPNAAKKYKMSEEAINEINKITAIGFTTVLVNEIQLGDSAFAARMSLTQLDAMKEIAPYIGVTINSKALPAPDADGNVTVDKSAIVVSKETKEKVAKEKAIEDKKPTLNPAEIKSEEQLRESLSFILSDKTTPQIFDRIDHAISFYKSYLQIKAKNAKDDAAYKAVESENRVKLFSEVTKICGEIPFSTQGLITFVQATVKSQKTPLKAFLQLKNAVSKSTNGSKYNDQYIADVTKVIALWVTNNDIAYQNRNIEESNKNLEILNKDAKKNAKAIEKENEKIAKYNELIKEDSEVLSTLNEPTSDVVDNLLVNYSDVQLEGYKLAKNIVENIIALYYPDADATDEDNITKLNHNIQQQAGIILNLFRDPTNNIMAYSISNLEDIKKIEKTKK